MLSDCCHVSSPDCEGSTSQNKSHFSNKYSRRKQPPNFLHLTIKVVTWNNESWLSFIRSWMRVQLTYLWNESQTAEEQISSGGNWADARWQRPCSWYWRHAVRASYTVWMAWRSTLKRQHLHQFMITLAEAIISLRSSTVLQYRAC